MTKSDEKKEQAAEAPKPFMERLKHQVKEFVIVFGGFLLLNNFVVASFLVPTGSMENEVMTGDFLMVNKFLYGASTPRNIMFTNVRLPWTTLPGFRDVERGDVIVFEFPGYREEVNPSEFTFYLKRCMALAGDTLEVRNRVVYINGEQAPLPKNMKFNFAPKPAGYADDRIFPPTAPFNEDHYGPVVVPKKGMTVPLTPATFAQWKTFIEREGRAAAQLPDGTVLVDGVRTDSYTVQRDYVFGMGDNRDNSLDSRFWGFIPREYVVGTPMFVYFSVADTREYAAELYVKGESLRMEWIYTTFSGHNILLDIVAKALLVVFNPEMVRFGRIGYVIG